MRTCVSGDKSKLLRNASSYLSLKNSDKFSLREISTYCLMVFSPDNKAVSSLSVAGMFLKLSLLLILLRHKKQGRDISATLHFLPSTNHARCLLRRLGSRVLTARSPISAMGINHTSHHAW